MEWKLGTYGCVGNEIPSALPPNLEDDWKLDNGVHVFKAAWEGPYQVVLAGAGFYKGGKGAVVYLELDLAKDDQMLILIGQEGTNGGGGGASVLWLARQGGKPRMAAVVGGGGAQNASVTEDGVDAETVEGEKGYIGGRNGGGGDGGDGQQGQGGAGWLSSGRGGHACDAGPTHPIKDIMTETVGSFHGRDNGQDGRGGGGAAWYATGGGGGYSGGAGSGTYGKSGGGGTFVNLRGNFVRGEFAERMADNEGAGYARVSFQQAPQVPVTGAQEAQQLSIVPGNPVVVGTIVAQEALETPVTKAPGRSFQQAEGGLLPAKPLGRQATNINARFAKVEKQELHQSESHRKADVAVAKLASTIMNVVAAVASSGMSSEALGALTPRIEASLSNEASSEALNLHTCDDETLGLVVISLQKSTTATKALCTFCNSSRIEIRVDGEIRYIQASNQESFKHLQKVVSKRALNEIEEMIDMMADE